MRQNIRRAALHMRPGTRAEQPPHHLPSLYRSLFPHHSLTHTHTQTHTPSSQLNITLPPPPPLQLRVCSNQNKNITTTGLVFLRFDCCGRSLQVRVSPVRSFPPRAEPPVTCRHRSPAALILIPRLLLTTCNDEGVTVCEKDGRDQFARQHAMWANVEMCALGFVTSLTRRLCVNVDRECERALSEHISGSWSFEDTIQINFSCLIIGN